MINEIEGIAHDPNQSCIHGGNRSNQMINEIGGVAYDFCYYVMKVRGISLENCRILVTANVGDSPKPLLLVGNIHRRSGYGHCIAILNPDEDLLTQVEAGRKYSKDMLIDIVREKCDLMLELSVMTDIQGFGEELSRYQASELKPAKSYVK